MLYVTSVIPWPINRGAAHRTDQVLRSLLEQDGISVDLVCLNQSEAVATSKSIAERLRKRYPKLRKIDVRRHPKFITKWARDDVVRRLQYQAALLLDKMLLRSEDVNSTDQCPPNLAALVNSRLQSGVYDFAWFNYLRVMPRDIRGDIRIFCDLHDYQTERVRVDVLPTLQPWRRKTYMRRFEASELKCINRCDVAIAISPVEADALRENARVKARIASVPASDEFRPNISGEKTYDLVFVGSRSDANVAGLAWFLDACFPSIVREMPAIRLLVQGTIIRTPIIKECVETHANSANITLSGTVPDLAAVYDRSRVVVCPVLHGTGMKIKMVEAMAFGKPIVATSKAAEGIALDLGLEVHDTPEAFSQACVQALRDEDYQERMRLSSMRTFKRDHDRSALSRALSQLLAIPE